MKRINILLLSLLPLWGMGGFAQSFNDTTYMDFPKDCTMKVNLRHDYTKTLTTKIFLAQSMFDGLYKHADNGAQKVYLTYEQAAERMKALDNITLGMPKIAYLVGWQYNGHDSKYPAVFEGNKELKRPQDKDALESLRWLMAEGKKYHTAVSLHINMYDVYEDSPWFQKCLQNDVLARNKAGFLRNSDWGYKTDYVQYWKSGLAKELIDSLCTLLPIQDAGSIHIDAFHTGLPIPTEQPDGTFKIVYDPIISPYHGWKLADETKAQIEIMKYWDKKGVDVTTEGLDTDVDGHNDPHLGYRPMVWHYDGYLYTKYPASMLVGGDCWHQIGRRLFGSNETLEPLLQKTPCDYKAVIERFCTSTLLFNYINRHERKCIVGDYEEHAKALFSDGLVNEASNEHYSMKKNGILIAEDDDMLIPALWMDGQNLIAFSKKGYKNKTWTLLSDYPAKGKVSIYSVDENGKQLVGTRSYSDSKLKLTVKPGQMLLIEVRP